MIDELITKGTSLWGVQLLIACFWAVLFLQSGWDKIKDWSGNLDWLKGHFSSSPFAGKVPFLLAVLTAIELSAGLVSLIGVFVLAFTDDPYWAYMGVFIAAKALLLLFLGQRLAKDYEGAASIATYFGVALISLFILHA